MVTVISAEELDKPIIRRKSVSVHNDGSMKAVVDCGEFGSFVTDEPVPHGGSGEGPSPLQAVLGALSGCKAVTFNRTAKEFGFSYQGIDFDSSFTIDVRGRKGVRGVVPHFQTIRVQANVKTDEPEDRLREVIEEVGARCPVYNLLKDAEVNVEFTWVRCPSGN
ncbi:OsmC family protein [Emcibacter sp.]|uniref:OsmC family protein n=1 Tax=Emcibacter sp. TaxID=1979954 RepID=UPI003A9445FF